MSRPIRDHLPYYQKDVINFSNPFLNDCREKDEIRFLNKKIMLLLLRKTKLLRDFYSLCALIPRVRFYITIFLLTASDIFLIIIKAVHFTF